MTIKIISENNVRDYMSVLTTDEIYGIIDGSLTSFVILVGKNNDPYGVMTVQIFPEYIRLERLFVLPEFRHTGIASMLLGIIKDNPKKGRLPIYAFLEDENDVGALLEESGFKKRESSYSVITGYLGDWIDLNSKVKQTITEDIPNQIKLHRINHVPEDLLRDFVLKSPHDELLQFPDKTMDFRRFSDISTVCTIDNSIKAALLVEETEDYSQFTWLCGEDRYALFSCLDAVKKGLESEYASDYKIRCLCQKKSVEKEYEKLFSKYDKKRIAMYRFS